MVHFVPDELIQRARDDARVACEECGHEIDLGDKGEGRMHDEVGCHAFDGSLDFENEGPCPCPERFTAADVAEIFQNYRFGPYERGRTVYWAGWPDEVGEVLAFKKGTIEILVKWKKIPQPVWEDDPSNLSIYPG